DLDEYVYEGLSAGASGFVLKDDPPEQLIAAIRTVAAGDALLSPAITKRVISRFARIARPEPPKGFDELTAREREILRLIATGLLSARLRRPPPAAAGRRVPRAGSARGRSRRSAPRLARRRTRRRFRGPLGWGRGPSG